MRPIAMLVSLSFVAGCGGILDVAGTMDPDGVDSPDHTDTGAELDGPDLPADVVDAEGDEVDGGCTDDAQCLDGELCNGQESCTGDGSCAPGIPEPDGTYCTTAVGDDGICTSGLCRPPGCGDGVRASTEECDDGNYINGDGCEANCTFTCHADADCDDADACTDDACDLGGNGRLCSFSFNTAACDDGDECTSGDQCDGLGGCGGVGYSCTAGVCEAASECDGDGGCTVTYDGAGSGCDDHDSCTSLDRCDGLGGCQGTGYSCTPGVCEVSSSCDGSGGCNVAFAVEGSGCSDADPCTFDDECDGSGACGGTAYACIAQSCEIAACDGSGGCSVSVEPEGTGCDDGDDCTHGDECDASGVCGGSAYSCTPLECEASSVCDGSGGCRVTFEGPGAGCDDSDACTTGDQCNGSGRCTGTPYSCTPGNCETATCDGSGGCVVGTAPTGTGCNDTNPCTHDDECDSGGSCNGIPYTCAVGPCEISSSCDGAGGCNVSYSAPGVSCNDLDPCSHDDECDGSGGCAGTGYSCTAGICEANSECDGSGGCIVTHDGPGTPCDDSTTCTHTDRCDAVGGCAGTPYSCTPGECETASSCNGDGGCVGVPAPAGTGCVDGYGCTTGDICNGAGGCAGIPDDTLCAGDDLCRPACFPASGCGAAPGSLSVDCPEITGLPADGSCTVFLDAMSGQGPCLSCSTEIGMVTLVEDFEGPGGACTLGDWWLVGGTLCSDDVDGCNPRNPVSCCDVAGTILIDVSGDCRLRTQRNTNCGGSHDEWQLSRNLDTRGLADLEVCFKIADHSANADEGILLYAYDLINGPDRIFCLEGPPIASTIEVDDQEWPYCAFLPSWAENNPGVVLTFIGHSNSNNQAMFLDDVVIKGWSSSCTPSRAVAMNEDFEPCPGSNPIPDGWNGWDVSTSAGSGPYCVDVCAGGSPGGAMADNGTWTMVRAVDTSGLDGDVRLCFDVGDNHADWNETILVSFDSGNALGWQTAWYWENEWGTDASCSRVCLELSAIDQSVAKNPNLQIRFRIASNQGSEQVFIDDIVLDGAVYCDGSSRMTVGALTDTGGGSYAVQFSNDVGLPMGAQLTCSWDTPVDPIEGWDLTWFTAP